MRYTYNTLDIYGNRRATDTNFEEALEYVEFELNSKIEVIDNLNNKIVTTIKNENDAEGWQTTLERVAAWKPHIIIDPERGVEIEAIIKGDPMPKAEKVNLGDRIVDVNPINPSHYQGYVMDLQWIETMQYLPAFRNPSSFKAAIELQARKYLDRNGKKDSDLQEIMKSIWYLRFLAAYIKNGNRPIRVKDIAGLLDKE